MRKPDLRRVLANIEVNDLPSVVAENDHGVEQPKRRARNNEHVDGHRVAHVVVQKAAPGRGGVSLPKTTSGNIDDEVRRGSASRRCYRLVE
jgi:hypothetical protein